MPFSAGKENKLQTQCLNYLDELNIYRINLHGSAWCGKGSPDVIACIHGRFVAFEFKVGKNDMQPDQRIRKKQIQRSGGLHFCPYGLNEFKSIVNRLLAEDADDGTDN